MDISLTSHINLLWVLQIHTQMNDMNDGPAGSLNLPLNYQASALPTELNWLASAGYEKQKASPTWLAEDIPDAIQGQYPPRQYTGI